MEFCVTLYIIGNYFMKTLQGYQFRRFCNIILGVHEYDTTSYDAFERTFLEEQNIKLVK